MHMTLFFSSVLEEYDAVVRVNHNPLALRLSRFQMKDSLDGLLLLCLPEFNAHPVKVTIKSANEVHLDTGTNWLEIYPTPRSIVMKELSSRWGRAAEDAEPARFCVPFLKLRNETCEPVIICESCLDLAFWLPPREEVVLDCISTLYESGFTFSNRYEGYLLFHLDDYTTLQVAAEDLPKVKSWGAPPGLEFWDIIEQR